jgi:hypothetical protein
MASSSLQDPLSPLISDPAPIIDPNPLIDRNRTWSRLFGPAVSFLILVAVAWQLRSLDLKGLAALVPLRPLFWVVFLAYYLAGPLSEWMIFRRLWHLPVQGIGALLRKMVSNEILLGYLGEVYFYAWARRNAHITTAPFGAIKDVAILSALTGNVVTLIMVVLTAPLFGSLHLGMDSKAFVGSTVFILLLSGVMLFMRKRLFTLPRRELWFVAATHLARIGTTIVLAAVMWHLLLPTVNIAWWLVLATVRQLVSRLPFVPNKDVVFAGIATFLVGSDTEIVSAMALMATLLLGAHLVVGAVLGIGELAGETRA